MTNPPPGGIMELRTAIADHLLAFRGMHVNPAQIIIGAGTEYLYGLLVQLLGRELTYAVEDPGYQKIAKIYNTVMEQVVDYCDGEYPYKKGVKMLKSAK